MIGRFLRKLGLSYIKRHLSRPNLAVREPGVSIDRSTVYRWIQKFGPELTKRTEKHLCRASLDWHVDETYIRVGGKWRFLWRAIDATFKWSIFV